MPQAAAAVFAVEHANSLWRALQRRMRLNIVAGLMVHKLFGYTDGACAQRECCTISGLMRFADRWMQPAHHELIRVQLSTALTNAGRRRTDSTGSPMCMVHVHGPEGLLN
jgi:hypothetical protein